MKHMKDPANGDKGTLADIMAAKEKVENEMAGADGLTQKKADAQKLHDELETTVKTTKENMDKAEKDWAELKGKAEVALNAVKEPLE